MKSTRNCFQLICSVQLFTNEGFKSTRHINIVKADFFDMSVVLSSTNFSSFRKPFLLLQLQINTATSGDHKSVKNDGRTNVQTHVLLRNFLQKQRNI